MALIQNGYKLITLAKDLCELSRDAGLSLRLFGSCAIFIKCEHNIHIFQAHKRYPKDIDGVILEQDRGQLRKLLVENGWHEDIELAAQTDGKRLTFYLNNNTLDICIDKLQFAQTLNIKNRILIDYPTLPAADLLLTKLQIQHLTRNDIIDIYVLLVSLMIVKGDETEININRITSLTSSSWRWYQAVVSSITYTISYIKKTI